MFSTPVDRTLLAQRVEEMRNASTNTRIAAEVQADFAGSGYERKWALLCEGFDATTGIDQFEAILAAELHTDETRIFDIPPTKRNDRSRLTNRTLAAHVGLALQIPTVDIRIVMGREGPKEVIHQYTALVFPSVVELIRFQDEHGQMSTEQLRDWVQRRW